jgi:hypothetical protein
MYVSAHVVTFWPGTLFQRFHHAFIGLARGWSRIGWVQLSAQSARLLHGNDSTTSLNSRAPPRPTSSCFIPAADIERLVVRSWEDGIPGKYG